MAVTFNNGSKVVVSVAGAGLKGDEGAPGGGLSSVSLTMPEGFEVAGSPVTGVSGTFTVTMEEGFLLLTQADKDKLDGLGGDAPVTSVNTKTGAVDLDFEDVGAEPARDLVSEAEAIAGTATNVRGWSALRVRQSADEAVGDALGGGLGAIIDATSLTGAYLGRITAPVGTGNIVGYTGIGNVGVLRIDGLLIGHPVSTPDDSGFSYPVLRARFSTDNGSTWGSWQDFTDWPGPFYMAYPSESSVDLVLFLNLGTGAYQFITKGTAPTGSFTVPADCNGIQFSLPGTQGGFTFLTTVIEGRPA